MAKMTSSSSSRLRLLFSSFFFFVFFCLMDIMAASATATATATAAAAASSSSSSSSNSSLRLDFYHTSCPSLSSIVSERVSFYSSQDPTTPAPLLRLFFHDCFVQGCDASVLLNSSSAIGTAEKDAPVNFSLGNFDVIDDIKKKVEKACPETVSCADILALAAVYAIKQAGGPLYEIELGRRDSSTSSAKNSQKFLPGFSMKVNDLMTNFGVQGLNVTDLIALSGAHTIGQGHCKSISNRLYPKLDNTYHKGFGSQLLNNCTLGGKLTPPKFDDDVQVFDDSLTPLTFDNGYYKGLQQGYGLFTSDASLYSDNRTRALVDYFANNQAAFFQQFGKSLQKMGRIGVLTGTQGEIRSKCWIPNSH